jgi:hypothetical protein
VGELALTQLDEHRLHTQGDELLRSCLNQVQAVCRHASQASKLRFVGAVGGSRIVGGSQIDKNKEILGGVHESIVDTLT